ncbi:hypothetical protein ALO56_101474 [Pseudomonas viridiflava]|uniref:Uncharacterized protein n=1 Tax=Pseudomonas syringae pv. ribicola TaxID=55398 RepID=A0A0P9ZDT2_PSESI|nr:hypothetical protein ALO47_101419 [Pseudomonas syringae pv. ribicola]KPZ19712.1 hypothetical protein ALO56_101474 [Pseudomonas viridiflava]
MVTRDVAVQTAPPAGVAVRFHLGTLAPPAPGAFMNVVENTQDLEPITYLTLA